MKAEQPTRVSAQPLVIAGLIVIALYVAVFEYLLKTTTYDVWGGLVIGLVIVLVSVPILARSSRREHDRSLVWIFCAALFAKMFGALVRYYIIFDFYQKGDARTYNRTGAEIAQNFLHGHFTTGLPNYTDTNFINILTGVVYTITRPTVIGGFLVFAWMAFWGLFLFYRAFRIAVPQGDGRQYAYLLFFLPSMAFWSSSIGKEAWLTLALGIAAYGAAKILTGHAVKGMALFLLGLAGTAGVRAHTAGVVAIALAVALVLRKPHRDRGHGVLARLVLLVLVGGLAVGVVVYSYSSLRRSGLSTTGGVSSLLQQSVDRSAEGGSGFTPTLPTTPKGAVVATFTVLFRPLVVEAGSAQELASALEGAFLLVFVALRTRWILAALGSIRKTPYIAFAIATACGMMVTLSSFGNFGILARERVTMFPFFLALLVVPPGARRWRRRRGRGPSEDGSSTQPSPTGSDARVELVPH
jgi:hypothetical protein